MKDYEIITVYCAHGDGGERSRGPVIGVYTTQSSAAQAAKGKGWYGGDGGTTTAQAIRLSDGKVYLISSDPIDLDEQQKNLDEQLRTNALGKLSAEEKRVLGL